MRLERAGALIVEIREVVESDRDWILKQRGSTTAIARSRLHQIHKITGLLAVHEGSPVGLLAYRDEGDQIEIVTLSDLGLPTGSTKSVLLCVLLERAYAAQRRRLWLVMTNDCVGEIGFCRSVGFDITAIRRDALNVARRSELDLPDRGWFGIQVRDEIEMERQIVMRGYARSSHELTQSMLHEDLRVLAQSDRLTFGRFGFGQQLSTEATAFQGAIAQRNYSQIQTERLLEIGTPAGRLYGACLLHALDPVAGTDAFRRLLGDDAGVTYGATGSCRRVPTTVSRCAEWLISAGDMGMPGGLPRQVGERLTRLDIEWAQSYNRGRAEAEAFRLDRLARMNNLTERMIERLAREGSIACPHCGVRGSHKVRRPGGERLTHAICKTCGRSFMGDDEKVSRDPGKETVE